MNPIRLAARPMLASMFIMGGIDALRTAEQKAPVVDDVTEPLGDNVPDALRQVDNEQLVMANGAAQLVGGTLLALGKLPRLSSAVLAATLVPTTYAGHRFWEETDEGARTNQQIHFFKNVSMLGGLLITAMDTEGRPGVAWRAGHALEHAGTAVERSRREARLARKLAKAQSRGRARAATGRTRREAKLAARLAKAEAKNRTVRTSERARAAANKQSALARTRTKLAKKKLTPDVADLTRGVRSMTSSNS